MPGRPKCGRRHLFQDFHEVRHDRTGRFGRAYDDALAELNRHLTYKPNAAHSMTDKAEVSVAEDATRAWVSDVLAETVVCMGICLMLTVPGMVDATPSDLRKPNGILAANGRPPNAITSP